MKYIYHHLGLGDHIICNGMVRHFQKMYETVSIFCKFNNLQNVTYMYRDNENIKIIGVTDDDVVYNYISENNISEDLIVVGFHKLNQVSHERFDDGFYKTANLSFHHRFNDFFFKRDIEKEKKIYEEINPENKKYIFIHGVDSKKVRSDLKIIDNPTEYSIFDLLFIIENAEEVHLMESSIKNLVNSYYFNKPKFFYHQYSRNYPEYNNTQGLNKFEIIK
jgi:hypothetical protein